MADPRVIAEMQEEEEAKAEEAKALRRKEDAKTPEDLRNEARNNVDIAGEKMAGRVAGMIGREAGRLMDQFSVLNKESTKFKVTKRIWKSFMESLDEHYQEYTK